MASLDGSSVVAYVVGPIDAMLDNTDAPSNHDTPIGRVVQIRTSDGGIQNQTLRDHGMYNGAITRTVITRDGMRGNWTHVIGTNKAISKGCFWNFSFEQCNNRFVNKKTSSSKRCFRATSVCREGSTGQAILD
jgi:hypothetical protein